MILLNEGDGSEVVILGDHAVSGNTRDIEEVPFFYKLCLVCWLFFPKRG